LGSTVQVVHGIPERGVGPAVADLEGHGDPALLADLGAKCDNQTPEHGIADGSVDHKGHDASAGDSPLIKHGRIVDEDPRTHNRHAPVSETPAHDTL